MARKKNKAITINRNRYNDIKRMDHGSMEEYVNEVYEKGVEAGQKAAAGSFDTALAMEAISQIKGITSEGAADQVGSHCSRSQRR